MTITIHNDTDQPLPVSNNTINAWVQQTLAAMSVSGEIAVCFVSVEEMRTYNNQYRHQDKPTNVLSFPSELPSNLQSELNELGDMIVCPDVLAEEADFLNKPLIDHWAHIIVHGVLHLLGYDHIQENDARIMQAFEIKILTLLNVANPYSETEGAAIEH